MIEIALRARRDRILLKFRLRGCCAGQACEPCSGPAKCKYCAECVRRISPAYLDMGSAEHTRLEVDLGGFQVTEEDLKNGGVFSVIGNLARLYGLKKPVLRGSSPSTLYRLRAYMAKRAACPLERLPLNA